MKGLTRKVAMLAIGYIVLLLGLATSIVINVNQMRVVAKDLDEMIISDVKTMAAYSLTVQRFVTEAQSYLQSGNPTEYEESAETLEQLEALLSVLNKTGSFYQEITMVAEQHDLLEQVATDILQMSQRLYAYLPPNPANLAPDQRETREAFTEQSNQHLAFIRSIVRQKIDNYAAFTFASIALALVGMLALTVGVLWAMQRWIAQPLRALTAAALICWPQASCKMLSR